MIFVQTISLFFAVIATIVILFVIYRAKYPFRLIISSAALGIGTLAAVNLLGAYTGVVIAVNYVTTFFAVVLGLPGVILLLVLRILLLF